MGQVFISHVEEDAHLAFSIALALEEKEYGTWLFEIDSIPGPSYFEQTIEAIQISHAFLLLVSREAIKSRQLDIEITRAHESGKPIIPLLYKIAHIEFQRLKPVWHHILGGSTSIKIHADGVQHIIKQLLAGLNALGVSQGTSDSERIAIIKTALQYYSSLQVYSPGSIQKGDDRPIENYQLQLPTKSLGHKITVIVYEGPIPKVFNFDGHTHRKIIIGRDPFNEIVLSSHTISGKHTMLMYDLTRGWWIIDLGSANGTYHMGRSVKEMGLRPLDEIEIGDVRLVVQDNMEVE
jgi:pSer/pThr/pTyr-binding forkhead associated (FHA) protein